MRVFRKDKDGNKIPDDNHAKKDSPITKENIDYVPYDANYVKVDFIETEDENKIDNPDRKSSSSELEKPNLIDETEPSTNTNTAEKTQQVKNTSTTVSIDTEPVVQEDLETAEVNTHIPLELKIGLLGISDELTIQQIKEADVTLNAGNIDNTDAIDLREAKTDDWVKKPVEIVTSIAWNGSYPRQYRDCASE